MPLFSGKTDDRDKLRRAKADEVPKDEHLVEELSELVASGEPKDVTEAMTDAHEAISKATKADITGIKLIEFGRCPQCQRRTENFLYTVVCSACGWFRRVVPDSGRTIVHLDTGERIDCDRVFTVQDGTQLLCVSDGVVRSQVSRQFVRRVEYVWEDAELEEAKTAARRRHQGCCSWCDRALAELEDEEGPSLDYIAFGRMQERFAFCSEKCMAGFRKQFPSRVDRNCYETDCEACDKCIKRYDLKGFKRVVLP